MKAIMSMAVAAALLGGASLMGGSPAQAADVHVAAGPAPVIAFGYNDGYWDREHRWHNWRNRAEMARWREANREHFFARRHDREHDQGWRNERWWERH